jgi:hypothetical protein
MKKYIFTEEQIKKVINRTVSEQEGGDENMPTTQNQGMESNQVGFSLDDTFFIDVTRVGVYVNTPYDQEPVLVYLTIDNQEDGEYRVEDVEIIGWYEGNRHALVTFVTKQFMNGGFKGLPVFISVDKKTSRMDHDGNIL